jgi:hypothetical protein
MTSEVPPASAGDAQATPFIIALQNTGNQCTYRVRYFYFWQSVTRLRAFISPVLLTNLSVLNRSFLDKCQFFG